MKPISIVRRIQAPPEVVFHTISDISQYSKAVPHIAKVEFLTEQRTGKGTRFRETRLMKGREHQTELEVTEYVENERVRLVADAGGTNWDTLFVVKPVGGAVELQMTMEARPHTLLARLMNPLIRGMVLKGVESDMDAVKVHCERAATPA